MKVRISMIAEANVLIDLMLMTGDGGKIIEDSIEIEPLDEWSEHKKVIRKVLKETPAKAKPTKAKPKRKPGRPTTGVPDKVLAAVRQLQHSAVAKNGGGAPLNEIKKVVKSPSVSPVITTLIKTKKLKRASAGHYKVA